MFVEKMKDFPILSRQVNGHDLVYLDNAATTQKPQVVLDALIDYYTKHNANVHRGLHTLSEEATEMYELARENVAKFIGAAHSSEVIFTKGTTESLNRVAFEWGFEKLKKGDVILLTEAEHHSNLIPWQIVSQRTGAELRFVEVARNSAGETDIDVEQFSKKLTPEVKLVAIFHASNVLGTILPVKEICKMAGKVGAKVVVDGAQSVPHMPVNVQQLGCDFFAFSGHKMFGPMGVGVLWVKRELLNELEPYEYGGGMISEVGFDSAAWADPPEKFEAGTPNVAGAVGLSAAAEFLNSIGMQNVWEHCKELGTYALKELGALDGIKILGAKDPEKRAGLVTFTVDGLHAHDTAAVLNTKGIAVRSGHHCEMPLHRKLGIPASVRASYTIYNTKEDIDRLVWGIKEAADILK